MSKHISTDMAANPPSKRQKRSHPPRTDLKSVVLANGDGARLTASATKPPKSLKPTQAHESPAAVLKRDDIGDVDKQQKISSAVVEISSDSSSDVESSGDDDDEPENAPTVNGTGRKVNGHNERPEINGPKQGSEEPDEEAKGNDEADVGENAEQDELSFGELVRARDSGPIDIEAAFVGNDDDTAIARRPNTSLSAPSANSLGTVLTQALRTNDAELMESCFLVHDLDGVRATIERLPSNLVASLLHKLAEKMQKRPGRAGHLMVWVQWALVSHGGYLAGQADLMKRVGGLYRVINERATSLQPLLQLKGKLDMLNAQMELRKSMQQAADASKDEDDNPVIYVEGQEESSDEDEDEDEDLDGGEQPMRSRKAQHREIALSTGEDDDEDGMHLINGISQDDHLPGNSEDEDDNLIDDEAEETSDDEETSGEEEFDEESDDEDVSDSEEEPTGPPKRSVTASTRFTRR